MLDLSSSLTEALPLTFVIPMRNEEDNAAPLLAEIAALQGVLPAFEVIVVDDGSKDATAQRLAELMTHYSWLRMLQHDKSYGQSAAIRSGVLAARGQVIATLDGDGQNNPAFIPQMYATWQSATTPIGLVAGQRTNRKDGWRKTLQSRIANGVRQWILKDSTTDSGCGLKLFPRHVYLRLPFFAAVHRFLPALVLREGYTVQFVAVEDRPRFKGVSNYGLLDRLGVGILDLFGVWWLRKRYRFPMPNSMKPLKNDVN
jgi:dolichol-phosphate mannosyltransferase